MAERSGVLGQLSTLRKRHIRERSDAMHQIVCILDHFRIYVIHIFDFHHTSGTVYSTYAGNVGEGAMLLEALASIMTDLVKKSQDLSCS